MTPEAPWRQLHRLTVALYAIYGVGFAVLALVPTALGMVSEGATVWLWLAGLGAVVLAAAVAGAGHVVWLITRYRVTDERVERRSGLLLRSYTSIPRDRVRSADLTANPVYQILGLSKVTVGTGQQAGAEQLVLDPVGKDEAERLRQELLRRTAPGPAVEEPPTRDGLIAVLDWSWIRYAPLSVLTLLIGLVPLGAAYQVLNWLGADLVEEAIDREVWRLVDSALLSLVLLIPPAVVVSGVIGVVLLFVEGWWNYRLERESDGTLRVRRGLLTTRSISLEERRLRGADVAQPLLVRAVGAARVEAVATGLGSTSQNAGAAQRSWLLPPAPHREADRVVAAVLREEQAPRNQVPLRPHPRAALRRRLVWLLSPTVAAIVGLAIAGALVPWLPWWVWIPGLLGLPVAAAFAVDAYRGLGHAVTERYLVTRYGTVNRRTVALQRSGVIGVTARQTFFQRRAGLVTLGATTAAGHGVYLIRDADIDEGLAFAELAMPDLLTPFLERRR